MQTASIRQRLPNWPNIKAAKDSYLVFGTSQQINFSEPELVLPAKSLPRMRSFVRPPEKSFDQIFHE
jgi:hypothetical protein